MLIFKLWTKASRCRRLKKMCHYIPNTRYVEYILLGSFLPLLMVGFLFSCYFYGRGKGDFGDKLITLLGSV